MCGRALHLIGRTADAKRILHCALARNLQAQEPRPLTHRPLPAPAYGKMRMPDGKGGSRASARDSARGGEVGKEEEVRVRAAKLSGVAALSRCSVSVCCAGVFRV
jgi:hypothetical protein